MIDITHKHLLCLFEQPTISVSRVQMNFLHLLSSEAVQHIIIHCLNFSVWRSAEDQPAAQRSVRFKSWSGEMFEAGGELEPEVIEDSCRVGPMLAFLCFKLVAYDISCLKLKCPVYLGFR